MSNARGILAPLIKLIAFVVVTVLATYVLVATIGNTGGEDASTYRARFTDVTGLLVGDDVRVAGVQVGKIERIAVVDHNQAEVSFSVVKSRPLPTSVIAAIKYRNLVGQRYLDISQGAGAPGTTLAANAEIPVSQTRNALDLTVLFAGFKPLFEGLDATSINDLSKEIIDIFQGQGGTISALFEQTAQLTDAIADKDAVIGNLITNLDSLLTTVNSRDTQLNSLITQLRSWVGGLAQDRVQIGQSLDGINALTSTTAGFLQVIRPPLAQDIKDVQALSKNINAQSDVYSGVLQRLPVKVAALTRTATYGSWFNFYLCEFNATLTLGPISLSPNITTASSRCNG
ncbi:MCE family protein [Jatrophihabitans sp. YIM 134969]